MKVFRILLFFVITVLGKNSYAAPSVDTCELWSKLYIQKLETFLPKNLDSVNYYLEKWRTDCGSTEPILRIKTLTSIIAHNDSDFQNTFDQYIRNFYITCIKRQYYEDRSIDAMYSIYRNEFGFLPFNGLIDKWTRATSQSLLASGGNSESVTAALYLFTGNLQSFDSILRFTRIRWLSAAFVEGKLPRNNSFGPTSQYGAGICFPAGLQRDYFPPSIQVGYNLGLYKRNYRASIEYRGRFSYVKDRIQFQKNSEVFDLNRFLIHDLGFVGSKILYGRRNSFALEPQLGIGYELVQCRSFSNQSGAQGKMTFHAAYAELGVGLLRQHNMGTYGLVLAVNYSTLPETPGMLNNFGGITMSATIILKNQ